MQPRAPELFRPVESTTESTAQQTQFQRIPQFVPGDLNTLPPQQTSRAPIFQPVTPSMEAPRLPDDSWGQQPIQAPGSRVEQQPVVDLPPPSFGRQQPPRFRTSNRNFNQIEERKQEFNLPHSTQASVAPPRFETRPLPISHQPPFEVNGNVQQSTHRPTFQVDQSVQQPTIRTFDVDNEAFRKRDPLPQPTPAQGLEPQFVAHPKNEPSSSVDSSPAPMSEKLKHLDHVNNPYATQRIQPQENINSRYIPPTGVPQPQEPIQTFDINSQYIPPAPMTIAPPNPDAPSTTRAPLPKIISQPHPNTYPPNLEDQYSNKALQKEVPLPKLETQPVSRPPIGRQTLIPVATTKREVPTTSTTVLPKLEIKPIKTHDKPHSVALPSEPNRLPVPESIAEPTTQGTVRNEHKSPHSVSLPSEPKIVPPSATESSGGQSSNAQKKELTHSVDLPGGSQKAGKQEEFGGPKASGAKTRIVKHEDKVVVVKTDKEPPMVSASTEIISSSTTTAQRQTTEKPAESVPVLNDADLLMNADATPKFTGTAKEQTSNTGSLALLICCLQCL